MYTDHELDLNYFEFERLCRFSYASVLFPTWIDSFPDYCEQWQEVIDGIALYNDEVRLAYESVSPHEYKAEYSFGVTMKSHVVTLGAVLWCLIFQDEESASVYDITEEEMVLLRAILNVSFSLSAVISLRNTRDVRLIRPYVYFEHLSFYVCPTQEEGNCGFDLASDELVDHGDYDTDDAYGSCYEAYAASEY